MKGSFTTLVKGIGLEDVITKESQMKELIDKAYTDAHKKYGNDIKSATGGKSYN